MKERELSISQADIASRRSDILKNFVPVQDSDSLPGKPHYKEISCTNAMSIDVEDYYQVSAFDKYVKREDWDNFPSRVEANVDRLLLMLDSAGVKATLFTLGWVAERHPAMVRRIVAQGHEIASHGYMHYRVNSQKRDEFADDISRSKKILEDISGQLVSGYRAPSYSVDESTPWAHDELFKAGYSYSSSVVPVNHDHYGIPGAPRFPFHVNPSGILEIPVATYSLNKRNHPCGGGGWFRLYPYALTKLAIKRINEREGKPCVFYIHPWEIDPDQPRQTGLDVRTRFRHYVNLKTVEPKLNALLRDFNWGRMDELYLPKDAQLR